MEDYELTIGTIGQYKNKACKLIESNCDKCTAMYEYNNKKWCCFDTVNFFIEWSNKYKV